MAYNAATDHHAPIVVKRRILDHRAAKVAASESSALGVRVNAVGSGFIDTPLLAAVIDDEEFLVGKYPSGHPRTDKVAHLMAFLASEAAGFVTGRFHLVKGGYTAL